MEDPEKCFSCKHFRFNKPEPEFCTIKKKQTDPLSGNHKCYVLRKDFFNRIKSSENRIKRLKNG